MAGEDEWHLIEVALRRPGEHGGSGLLVEEELARTVRSEPALTWSVGRGRSAAGGQTLPPRQQFQEYV
jgi:hypothetical protein